MRRLRLRHAFVSVVSFAIAACSAPEQSTGKQSFERNCGSCHAQGKLPGTRATGLADPQKRSGLDQFLAQHHASKSAVRAEIIEYLVSQEK